MLAWLAALPAGPIRAEEPSFEARLLVALSSYRDRPRHAMVYFYEHDGRDQGRIVGKIPAPTLRVDTCPSLSSDGRWCAIASEVENQVSRVLLWDRQSEKLIDMPSINDSPHAQVHVSLTGDASVVAFAAWNHPDGGGRWDVMWYDRSTRLAHPLPGLSTQEFDEQMPALSGDGRWLACVSNSSNGAGLADIWIYDHTTGDVENERLLNSPARELEPAWSGDGQLLAFVSDRRGGVGGRDIYLFDRQAGKLLPLPGLNSVGHEQSPSLSPDGRYLAFVSERIQGAGERDIFLYDRTTSKLLPTPGLNAPQEDMDPCVTTLAASAEDGT